MVLRDLTRFELILMDNNMPRMTGTVAAREMRNGGYSGVILGLTGDPVGSPERDEFEAAGLNACVDKDTKGVEQILKLLRGFALPAEPSAAVPAELAGARAGFPAAASEDARTGGAGSQALAAPLLSAPNLTPQPMEKAGGLAAAACNAPIWGAPAPLPPAASDAFSGRAQRRSATQLPPLAAGDSAAAVEHAPPQEESGRGSLSLRRSFEQPTYVPLSAVNARTSSLQACFPDERRSASSLPPLPGQVPAPWHTAGRAQPAPSQQPADPPAGTSHRSSSCDEWVVNSVASARVFLRNSEANAQPEMEMEGKSELG